MRDTLIIFGVLFLLLILVCTFGGSIRYNEAFDEVPAAPAPTPAAPEQGEAEKHKHVQGVHESNVKRPEQDANVEPFEGDMYAGVGGPNEDEEQVVA